MKKKYFLNRINEVENYIIIRLSFTSQMSTNHLLKEGQELVHCGIPRFSKYLLRKALKELRQKNILEWWAEWYGRNAGYQRIYRLSDYGMMLASKKLSTYDIIEK